MKEFARGCMRTYMILKEKARTLERRRGDPGPAQARSTSEDADLAKLTKKYSSQNAKKLLEAPLDRVELAKAPLPYEKLDQLTMEVLMGVR